MEYESKETANQVGNGTVLHFTQRLNARLEQMHSYPMTLVEAPMGYGKTVAVREHLRGRSDRVVWGSALENGENAFWSDFCAALARVFPDNAETVESLARLGYPLDSVRTAEAAELLLQLDFSPSTIVVVDDIHLLGAPESGGMHRLCALLARRNAPHLRMVLISRDTWSGERELLALKGQLALVEREAFTLDAAEIRDYYSRCGVNLSESESITLEQVTGGWISALYLYLLQYRKRGLFVRPTAIGALLEKEVLSALPERARELLFWLCPLERFSAEQANFLLDDEHGEADAILNMLRKRNSFITHDEADGSYALHSIFRQHLGELFARLPEDKRRRIHSRHADWFEAHNDASRAIDAAYAAGDLDRALRVLEIDSSRNLVTARSHFFMDLFRACPDEVLERHMGAMFKYTLAAYSIGDKKTVATQMAWLREKLAAGPDEDPQHRAWRGELEFLFSLAAYNDIEAMSRHHRKAYELLGGRTRLFGQASWTLGCPSVLFMFHRKAGELGREVQSMHQCLPHYYKLAGMHGAGGEYLMEAEAHFVTGAFTDAAIVCHRAQLMALAHGQLDNILCALFLRMRMALFEANHDAAQGLLQSMREMIREKRDYFLLHSVDLCEGFMQAGLGRVEGVPGWLRVQDETSQRLYTFAGGFYYIVHGRALLLDGKHVAAAALFAWLLETGAFAGNLVFSIHAHIYMAAAHAALHKPAEAEAELRRALDDALPDKLLMPFVENSDLLQAPLHALAGRKEAPREGDDATHADGTRAILELASVWEKSKRKILALHYPSGLGPLTARELEMARLAAQGKKYKEIAETLYLAPSTVKKAFAVMLKKLGIHGREELRAYLAEHDTPAARGKNGR